MTISLGAFQTVSRCSEEQATGSRCGDNVPRRACLSPRDPPAKRTLSQGARGSQPASGRGLLGTAVSHWGPARGTQRQSRPSASGLRPAPSPSPWLRGSRCRARPLSPFSRELADRHFRETSHSRTSLRDTTHFRASPHFRLSGAAARLRPWCSWRRALWGAVVSPGPVTGLSPGCRPLSPSPPRARPPAEALPPSRPPVHRGLGGGLRPSSLHSAPASPPSRPPEVRSLQGLRLPVPRSPPRRCPPAGSWGGQPRPPTGGPRRLDAEAGVCLPRATQCRVLSPQNMRRQQAPH